MIVELRLNFIVDRVFYWEKPKLFTFKRKTQTLNFPWCHASENIVFDLLLQINCHYDNLALSIFQLTQLAILRYGGHIQGWHYGLGKSVCIHPNQTVLSF